MVTSKNLKLIALLAVMQIVRAASPQDKISDQTDLDPSSIRYLHDEEHYGGYVDILWIVTRYKGFMQGIGQGFYDNPAYLIDDRCLGEDAIRAIDNLVEGFRHGINAFDKVLKSMTAVVTLFVSVTNNCHSS
jgi:hypothetical protein